MARRTAIRTGRRDHLTPVEPASGGDVGRRRGEVDIVGKLSSSNANSAAFGDHAVKVAKRQYFQPGDETVLDMFERVARWVAQPEPDNTREDTTAEFYRLMAEQRFCPGGRVLAGAATEHGNVLNCFVQDGSPEPEGTNAWVLSLATKLALVTKVGGGNGLNLDPIAPKRRYDGKVGRLYLTVDASHPDHDSIQTGTFLDLVRDETVTKGYRVATFVERSAAPHRAQVIEVPDSVEGIWDSAGEAALSLLGGRDVVVDLSLLRPVGTVVRGSGGTSSGPASFAVEIFDNFAVWAGLGGADHAGPVSTLRYVYAPSLRAIKQGGTRRGAGMATLSITHPDVQDFITAKDLERERDEGDISTFNISVLVTDGFMQDDVDGGGGVLRDIAQHAWATGEPGLIYIDRINEHNAMRTALGSISATNPCGEIALYPGEPCDLGAINMAQYVSTSGSGIAGFDMPTFRQDVATCVRFLDDVLDVNRFALEDNREMSMKLRRLGLGVMGLADALIKMGYGYNTDEGREAVHTIITALREAATEASESLATERGPFPLADQADIETPRRNVAILTVAPTGTTSMLMGVSSGVEPVFAPFIYRKIGADYHALIHPLFQELLDGHPAPAGYAKGGQWDWDAVVKAVQDNHGSVQGLDFIPEAVRRVLICAHDITPSDHVKMQATVQRAFDGGAKVANSISKTINLPNSATVEDVYEAYKLAFETQCKGITVYRDGSREFQVLSTTSEKKTPETQPEAHQQAPVGAPALNGGTAASTSPNGAGRAPVVVKAPPADVSTTRVAVAAKADHLPGEPLFERSVRLSGFTDKVKLLEPNGEKRGFYVTVNKQDDFPTEVFIQSGKGGDEANADSEALGRVVSIALQYGVPAEAIIKTLRGINGGMYGTYQGRMVASKADIIAVALETAGVENVLNRGKGCPDCGAPLRFEEGCQKCESCGYSKCG